MSCELLGHVYSHLYGIRFLGLRFFTVYGPRQRPDLAINKFVRLIEAGEPIPVFGDGSTRRDYTFIADIVEGIIASVYQSVAAGAPQPQTADLKPQTSCDEFPSYAVINLGNDQTVTLSEMIETIEEVVGKKAIIDRLPQQPGDVPQTWADVTNAGQLLGYKPTTTFKQGVECFVKWRSEQSSCDLFHSSNFSLQPSAKPLYRYAVQIYEKNSNYRTWLRRATTWLTFCRLERLCFRFGCGSIQGD